MSERVTTTLTDGVAEVRLNRPEKRNALDAAMFEAIIGAGTALHAVPGLRAVVLSGEGQDFCAGLDRASFSVLARGERPNAAVPLPGGSGPALATGQHAVQVWRELAVPVIAAVQGHALGGGLQIALGADIRIVRPDARLAVLEILWGLVPDMTGSQVLPELVGRDVAKELTLTGRLVSGDEAVRIGLATRVSDDPRADALELADDIAARSPEAVRWAKRLLDLGGRAEVSTGYAAEQEAMASIVGTANQAEAVAAALERRRPTFTDPS